MALNGFKILDKGVVWSCPKMFVPLVFTVKFLELL